MNTNTNQRKYKIKLLRLMTVYALIMLLAVSTALSFSSLRKFDKKTQTDSETTVLQTEYVYVKIENSDTQSDYEANTTQEKYTVREHMGMIGVFSSDGKLLRVIETYTKTLPEADRRLLKEGIEIVGAKQLEEIIQDYST